jgi:hypothetical protein
VRFRPQRPERRLQQAAETAVVVGPEGQDIYTDEYGRIKVQFHWDREGKRNERSSCWIRVSQAWAGPTFGFQFIPRVGIVIIVTLASTQSTRRRSWAHSIREPRGFTTPSPRLVRGSARRSRCRGHARAMSPRRSLRTATRRRASSPSASSSWRAATSPSPQLSPARAGPPPRAAASAARTPPTSAGVETGAAESAR